MSRFFIILATLEDVPRPAGFSEKAETAEGFAFEGQDRRLVEAHARGSETAAACRTFFTQTLPALDRGGRLGRCA